MLNNREIAIAIWLGIMLVWGISKRPIRTSLQGVIRAFFARKIVAVVAFMGIWTMVSVWFLYLSTFWTPVILKETILWFFFTGFVLMFSSMTSEPDKNVFGKILGESIKFIIVFEFLVSEYTFPLAVELVLVPALTFVAMLHVVAESREEYAPVAKFLGWVLAIVGFAILGYAVRSAAADLATLNSLDTVRKIFIAPVLSILLAPAIYIVLLVSSYETLFLRLRFGPQRDSGFVSFAKRRLIRHLGLNIRGVRAFVRSHAPQLMAVRTREDLELILTRDSKTHRSDRAAA